MRRVALVALLMIASATPAVAQVNTEKLRSWDSEGFGGAVDFSLLLESGNVDLVKLGAGVRVQYVTLHPPLATTSTTTKPRRHAKDLVLLIGDLTFGRNAGKRYLNDGFSHLRYTRMWWRRFGTEVYGQVQYNEFLRLKQRILAGAGFRAIPVDEAWGSVAVGSSPMLEIEEIDENLGVNEPRTTTVRWSNYVSLKFYLDNPGVQFVNTVYFQPRFTDFEDFRILSEGELGVQVVGALELVVAVSIFYDSRPPTTVKRLNTTVSNALRVSF